jgi:hypothetical protein
MPFMGNYLNDEERQALRDRLAEAEPMTAERAHWWYMVHNHWSEEAQERNKNKKPVSRYMVSTRQRDRSKHQSSAVGGGQTKKVLSAVGNPKMVSSRQRDRSKHSDYECLLRSLCYFWSD